MLCMSIAPASRLYKLFALRVTRRGHSEARGSWHPGNNVSEPIWHPRIILPKPQWHPMIIVWEPDGTLDHCPKARMALQIILEREKRPGIILLESQGTPGPFFWSQMAPRRSPKSTPGSLSGARMALRRPDGAPEAKSLHSSNLASPGGGTAGSGAPSAARAGATEGGRGEDKSSPGLGIRISTSLLVTCWGIYTL